MYRIAVGAATALSILSCLYWYFIGAREGASAALSDAKRVWTTLLVAQVFVATADLVTLALLLRAEGVAAVDYVLVSLVLALQAPVLFWLCTFLMSPRTVQFIPWGKRLFRRSR